jgi:signal transduction histidine kinase
LANELPQIISDNTSPEANLLLDGTLAGFTQGLSDLGIAVAVWSPNDTLMGWNERFADVFTNHAAILQKGTSWTDLIESVLDNNSEQIPPNGRQHFLNEELDARATNGQITSIGPDGRWYNKTIKPMENNNRVEIWHDVTDSRRQIIEQRETEERYSIAMQAANEGLFEWNLVTQELYLSPRAKSIIMGEAPVLSSSTNNNEQFRRLIVEEDIASFFSSVKSHISGNDPFLKCELRTRAPALPNRILRVRGLALRDTTGQAYRLAGFITDITDERVNEAALRLAKEEAEIANRTKTEFFANMSHELRTPLNAIIGFSEIIRDETFGAMPVPEYQEYIDDILISGQHLLSVINDILDVSKAEAGKLELEESTFTIGSIFKSCVRLVSERASKQGLAITVDQPEDLPWLRGDERKIKQMLLNLLSNSIKFTESGGNVVLGARITEGRVCLFVRDNGIGMSKQDLEYAMEPFGQVDSTLSRKHEGTGLGLPIVVSLCNLHGAEFKAESEPNQGTHISITFPLERNVSPKPLPSR